MGLTSLDPDLLTLFTYGIPGAKILLRSRVFSVSVKGVLSLGSHNIGVI
jgi:hypothetical protein